MVFIGCVDANREPLLYQIRSPSSSLSNQFEIEEKSETPRSNESSMTLSFLEDLRTPGRRKDFRGNFAKKKIFLLFGGPVLKL